VIFFYKFLKFYLCSLFLLFTVCLVGKTTLQRITFIPQWQPQAQFAGYYVAKDLGIYSKYGLDVNILPGGPQAPAAEMLEKRKADITTMFLSSAIAEKAKGLDIVNIGQTSQMSSLIFVAKKSSGIRTPADMNGKKIGIWFSDFKEVPLAFLDEYHIKATIVPIASTVDLFLEDGIDVMAVEWYNEYHQILNAGYNPNELVTFFFYDHHLNISEDGIYCLKSTYQRNPDVCDKFVKASMEGWEYAFSHPDVAVNIVIKYMQGYHNPANLAHQNWMLNRMKDIMEAEGKRNLGLKETDFAKTGYILLKNGMIKTIPTYKSFVEGNADATK
jgi:NitT/TauT family transport system substrate-binding protein